MWPSTESVDDPNKTDRQLEGKDMTFSIEM